VYAVSPKGGLLGVLQGVTWLSVFARLLLLKLRNKLLFCNAPLDPKQRLTHTRSSSTPTPSTIMHAVTRWQRGTLHCVASSADRRLSRRAALQLAPLAAALFAQQAQAQMTPYEEARRILLGPTKDGCEPRCQSDGRWSRHMARFLTRELLPPLQHRPPLPNKRQPQLRLNSQQQ
jgi:hypothetical protein